MPSKQDRKMRTSGRRDPHLHNVAERNSAPASWCRRSVPIRVMGEWENGRIGEALVGCGRSHRQLRTNRALASALRPLTQAISERRSAVGRLECSGRERHPAKPREVLSSTGTRDDGDSPAVEHHIVTGSGDHDDGGPASSSGSRLRGHRRGGAVRHHSARCAFPSRRATLSCEGSARAVVGEPIE